MWILDSFSPVRFSFRILATLRDPIIFCFRAELDPVVYRVLKKCNGGGEEQLFAGRCREQFEGKLTDVLMEEQEKEQRERKLASVKKFKMNVL